MGEYYDKDEYPKIEKLKKLSLPFHYYYIKYSRNFGSFQNFKNSISTNKFLYYFLKLFALIIGLVFLILNIVFYIITIGSLLDFDVLKGGINTIIFQEIYNVGSDRNYGHLDYGYPQYDPNDFMRQAEDELLPSDTTQ